MLIEWIERVCCSVRVRVSRGDWYECSVVYPFVDGSNKGRPEDAADNETNVRDEIAHGDLMGS